MKNFFEDIDNKIEYKYKCLVYPNITYQKDFSKDSYYIIMSRILEHLTKLRPDIYFTVLTPEIMPGFQYKNTEQIIYDQPTYPNTMRCHFDTKRMLEIINYKKKDWDFVYTYLPEHTLQLKNLFYNRTDCRPVFFGYSAYIEIPETTKYSMSMMRNHLNGILEMNTCGVNSQAVKDTIVENAKGEAIHDAITTSKADIIINPKFTITETDYFIFKTVKCEVTGLKGTINKVQ